MEKNLMFIQMNTILDVTSVKKSKQNENYQKFKVYEK